MPSLAVAAVAVLAAVCLLGGCGRPRTGSEQAERVSERVPDEVVAEAYLFDARVTRAGKPTSVRLEVYRTDSVIALNGRGYLGKGAFRGSLEHDTLVVYFPTTDEYAIEPVAELFASLACSVGLQEFPLAKLFVHTPDSIDLGAVAVVADYRNTDRPEFALSRDGCGWSLRLQYDRRGERWWLREFHLESEPDFELRGQRRTLREQARVPLSRFRVAIPEGAVRVFP